MPLLSIIVPVYKVEEFLSTCIESVLAQSLHDWELILIDDGSPDNCPAICESYAKQDSRIIVIHQENKGVSTARNRGLDIARGKYITFVDSDDYLAPNCYSRLLSALQREEADMAICGFLYKYPNGSTMPRNASGEEELLSAHELISRTFDIPWSIRCVTYNKVFKAHLLKNIRFRPELSCSEDTYFLHECLLTHKITAIFIKEPLYVSYQRPGSAMHGGLSLQSIETSLDIHKQIATETATIYPSLCAKAFLYYIDSCVWKMNAQLSKKHTLPEEASAWEKRIRHRILSEYPSILLCPLINWKQKIYYLLVGLNLR